MTQLQVVPAGTHFAFVGKCKMSLWIKWIILVAIINFLQAIPNGRGLNEDSLDTVREFEVNVSILLL